MVLTSSRWLLAVGILLPLGIGGAALYSARQQMETGSPIPPLSAIAAALLCFLISAFLIYTYFIQGKSNATTVRFPVFFRWITLDHLSWSQRRVLYRSSSLATEYRYR